MVRRKPVSLPSSSSSSSSSGDGGKSTPPSSPNKSSKRRSSTVNSPLKMRRQTETNTVVLLTTPTSKEIVTQKGVFVKISVVVHLRGHPVELWVWGPNDSVSSLVKGKSYTFTGPMDVIPNKFAPFGNTCRFVTSMSPTESGEEVDTINTLIF